MPENTVLSHDLLEGNFARAGLVSDVEVLEEFPSNYEVAALRQHRWTRGDWQLLPWILGLPPGRRSGAVRRRGMTAIGRFKLIDNLRRSLSAPALFLAFVSGWILPAASAAPWTGFVLLSVAAAPILPLLFGLVPLRAGISKRNHVRAVGGDLLLGLQQTTATVSLLAYQAWLMADAIARTLFRLTVSRRRLLEWVTATESRLRFGRSRGAAHRRLGAAVALAAGALLLVLIVRPESLLVAAPILALWLLSPLVARRISAPPRPASVASLSTEDEETLRMTARRTWSFFEEFVGPEDNALPPDNVQDDPIREVAHRTSPTNIGLYVLSTLAARDFGWIGTRDALDRLEATLSTIGRMEVSRGHLYNWYETRGLRPLEPKYVSTVDSGNLAGAFVALAGACRERAERPLLDVAFASGIADALLLVREVAARVPDERAGRTVTRRQLEAAAAALSARLGAASPRADSGVARLAEIEAAAVALEDIARTLSAETGGEAAAEALRWAEAALAGARGAARDAEAFLPWARPTLLDPAREAAASRAEWAKHWAEVERLLGAVGTPAGASDLVRAAATELRSMIENGQAEGRGAAAADERLALFLVALDVSAAACDGLLSRLAGIARNAEALFGAMDFGFLFDPTRKLLAIGYHAADGTLDASWYDLLGSEARLASFVAIAKGDVPASHWFRLGRALTWVGGGSALVSWSGSMFEYLMPSLVMRSPRGSLLERTQALVVRAHARHGKAHGVPWGVSEAAYNARGADFAYRYSGFGVPGLGLKRGLGDDLVVAPYATALAAMSDAPAAARNLRRLESAGAMGPYGYYDALDYTSARIPEGLPVAIVKTTMSHHQGMALVAIANALSNGRMRGRFHADPRVQASEMLLQERTPRNVLVSRPRAEEPETEGRVRDAVPSVLRRFHSPHDSTPRTHLLSNGRYVVMITAAGSGYSRCGDLAVSRWREDVTRDCHGNYVFLRDAQSGDVWSAGFQPTGAEPDRYEVAFSEDRAEISRRDGAIATTLEVVVSPEDDAEVRRVSVTNLGGRTREIELTSYAELVLAPHAADVAHPAFSNLFVGTEAVPERGVLLATRRERCPDDPAVWAAHVIVTEGESVGELEYETDRARFLGRGRGLSEALAVLEARALSGTTGAVLDPIVSFRRRVRLAPGATARVTFTTLVAGSRAEALDVADKYREIGAYQRTATLSWTQAQVRLQHLMIGAEEAELFQRVANRVIHSDPTLRASSDALARNELPASSLWALSISGDLPIVLVRIEDLADRELVRQLLRAHEYWRLKRLAVDLVILNEQPSSYAHEVRSSIEGLVRATETALRREGRETRGKVFILQADQVAAPVRGLLETAARVVLVSRRGTLEEQLVRVRRVEAAPATPRSPRPSAARRPADAGSPRPGLEFFNGLGGFGADGREYVIVLDADHGTPAPWINVVANPRFGFQVSESGSGSTWAENSRENQLTPWSNDPVSDPPGEAFYVRDEETGELFGPTALPIRERERDEPGPYVVRHGAGYSRFEHESRGIGLALTVSVAPDDPVKVSRLSIENLSGRPRRLSVTAYAEWVLGPSRAASAPFVATEIDPDTGAILARNAWNIDFGRRVAFADLSPRATALTGDRTEFLGRNGTPSRPAALEPGHRLSGKVGAGLDPCAALQTTIDLAPRGKAEVVFLLGQAATKAEARLLVARYRSNDLDLLERAVADRWDSILGAVEVRTPDRAMDLLLNRWLLYQVLSCRVFARSALYQSSGAFGFRDQLQDVLSLLVAKPDVAREHLLRAASRQFLEGDVQHWWHPPSGRGVRTRIADDAVWLSYAAVRYVETTGDAAILDESVAFLEGPPLGAGQMDSYFEPSVSERREPLFEHCARALDRSLGVGSHGLPLMGTGDWNDGMNRVGHEGKGESVWLGWLLVESLRSFSELAEKRGERERTARWRGHAAALETALAASWDGDWFRRAYFDDGTPLGTATDDECRIDSITQSWAAISGAAEPSRQARAMAAVDEHLVRREDGLVLLFTPPFDRSARRPGYVQGYPPGIRENGGQYTHAAAWCVLAFAALGDGGKAKELFDILNPIHHGRTRAGVYRYKIEPYVVAGDVYSEPPHAGRGGWSWYTGAAGWMYRAGLEGLLGFRLRGSTLVMDPCIPPAWRRYEIVFRHRTARYEIVVENPRGVSRGVARVECDGVACAGGVPLADDGATHRVRVVLG